MAELNTDRQLLRDYTKFGSESAFQTLVQRHLDLVFATAMRGLHDPQVAQEITQNVFIALARKAAWLRGETNLAAWLHKTTLLEVRHWWRGELRRERRERAAVELGAIMNNEDSLLKALTAELDEGLLELRQNDRQALMLRYFEGRTHREIGQMLGAREDAVRMRIDKALGRLTQFFRRRGYAVPAVATTVTVLSAAVKAAPTGLVALTARSAFSAGGGGALTGFQLLLARLLGLSKAQTTVLCIALAAAPIAWQWNANRLALKHAAAFQAQLDTLHDQQARSAADLERLLAESTRLDAALAEATDAQARYQQAARKLETLKARALAMLTDADYHWPGDLPYVRVPKAVVKSLDLLHRPPMAFGPSGELTEPAQEMFAITSSEKGPTEAALANYWRGIDDLMTATAYETNVAAPQPGRWTKNVVVPPLGQPLKDLAQETQQQLTFALGSEREQLLFAGWDQGAIQPFSPGDLWQISEQPQTFTVWVEPAGPGANLPRYGISRSCVQGGFSADSAAGRPLGLIPKPIAERFFNSWLRQFGITTEP